MNETLKKLREQNNYSQNSIATFLGISRQMYIKYEQGTIEPPVKVVKDLANFYRVPYEYIIDNKLAHTQEEKSDKKPADSKFEYSYKESEPLAVASSAPAYTSSIPSDYLNSVLAMLPKLIYAEQLQVLSKLCEMVKTQTDTKKEPSKKMQAYQKLLALNEELHLKSDGTKWTREELYERH